MNVNTQLIASLNTLYANYSYNSSRYETKTATDFLGKIDEFVQNTLNNPRVSENDKELVIDWIKAVDKENKIYVKDRPLWDSIKKSAEQNLSKTKQTKAEQTRSKKEFAIASHLQGMPPEVSSQIIEKMGNIELLQGFSSKAPPEEKFQLALRVGEELTTLDLSDFKELDDKKLKTLHEACPNLRLLNLSHTPIEKLDLSILDSFSKLERLDVSKTEIKTLDKLPKNVKELNLSDCMNISREEFLKLNDFPLLENLDVSNTKIDISGIYEAEAGDDTHAPKIRFVSWDSEIRDDIHPPKLRFINIGFGLETIY